MLEVKHLRKAYRSKNGVVTRALDDVSLNFPETGMIFILGKSGSGKSTLLNVCGGLDRMDSGEIIIKGKSSNEFSGQDFDSYRNTYVGFVFQEYNILEEFSVEDNIALALELQNKKPDKSAIAKILADVDLTDFASRKPNTLSGGQKQRVAIARALVKEPEIIMADEPTGALDSKTGKQVFDTLKRLSANKLVLVISHDRDFAEQYGDRIIELKDGKVISDQTRATDGGGEQNVRFFGTDTVTVTNGSELTDEDLLSIKNFLSRAGGTAVISTSRERIAQFKEDRPEISVGSFENVKEQPKVKEYPPQKLIRSRLPMRHAVKMGAGSLKTKPVRLVFTIFLSVIAFILFGLASTLMLFAGHDVTVQTFVDTNINFISLGKVYYQTEFYGDDSYETTDSSKFTQAEYDELVKKYGGAIPAVKVGFGMSNVNMSGNVSSFYGDSVNSVVPASDKLTIIKGRMPEADDEIAITDFLFSALKASGTRVTLADGETIVNISSEQDVIYSEQRPVVLINDDVQYKIVGVFKGANIQTDYQSLKDRADQNEAPEFSMGSFLWSTERDGGLYMAVAVTPAAFEQAKESATGGSVDMYHYFNYSNDELQVAVGDPENGKYDYFSSMAKYDNNALSLFKLNGDSLTSLGGNEFAVSHGQLGLFYVDLYEAKNSEYDNDPEYYGMIREREEQARDEYYASHPSPSYDDFLTDLYRSDYAAWEAERDAWLALEENEGKDEWDYAQDHPAPVSYDESKNYVDMNAYTKALDEYNNARSAYIESRLYDVRWDGAYRKLRDERVNAADEAFRAANPEPTEGTAEYDRWYSRLYSVRTLADPIYALNTFYFNNNNASLNEVKEMFKEADELFDLLGIDRTFTLANAIDKSTANVAGWFYYQYTGYIYLGNDLFEKYYSSNGYETRPPETNYEEPEDACLYRIFIPYDNSASLIDEILTLTAKREKDDSKLQIQNGVMYQLESIIETAAVLETAFLIAGAVFALFAFLLMFNFISASISAKKKEIGILRAIGARTIDVFKIFLSEAAIIAIICFALSSLGAYGLCAALNSIIMMDVGLSVSLFVFGIISVACVFGIALITAIISTVIPVAIYSRKPPIASIRAL